MAEFRGDNVTVRAKQLGGGGLSIRNLPAALSGRREAPTLASPIDVEANEFDEEGGDDLANSPSCACFCCGWRRNRCRHTPTYPAHTLFPPPADKASVRRFVVAPAPTTLPRGTSV